MTAGRVRGFPLAVRRARLADRNAAAVVTTQASPAMEDRQPAIGIFMRLYRRLHEVRMRRALRHPACGSGTIRSCRCRPRGRPGRTGSPPDPARLRDERVAFLFGGYREPCVVRWYRRWPRPASRSPPAPVPSAPDLARSGTNASTGRAPGASKQRCVQRPDASARPRPVSAGHDPPRRALPVCGINDLRTPVYRLCARLWRPNTSNSARNRALVRAAEEISLVASSIVTTRSSGAVPAGSRMCRKASWCNIIPDKGRRGRFRRCAPRRSAFGNRLRLCGKVLIQL